VPVRFLTKIILNTIIGGLVLAVINFVGRLFNYHIALNVVTAMVSGNLGIPGIVLLVVLKLLFRNSL